MLNTIYRKAAYARITPDCGITLLDKALHAFRYHGLSCRGRRNHTHEGHIIDRGRWLG